MPKLDEYFGIKWPVKTVHITKLLA